MSKTSEALRSANMETKPTLKPLAAPIKPEDSQALDSVVPVPEPPTFVLGDRVSLVGTIVDCDNSFGRFTVRMDQPLVGDNPFDVVVYARNLRKEP